MSHSQTRKRGHWVVEAEFKPGAVLRPRHCLPSGRKGEGQIAGNGGWFAGWWMLGRGSGGSIVFGKLIWGHVWS